MKGQTIRLLDVFVVAPVLISAGWHIREKPLGAIVAATGFLTFVYNLENYLKGNGNG